ncbi:MAG: zinc-dependent metalloprotease [Balneolaceae bacterium]
MRLPTHTTFAILPVLMIFAFGCATPQPASTSASSSDRSGQEQTSDFEKQLENHIAFEGLFTIFQDTTNGSTKLQIRKDQLGKEFIYFGMTADGVTEAGHFRGNYRDNKIFRPERYFERVELIVPATGYYFDDENPLSRASEANTSHATLVSEKIIAENDSLILISGDAVFLNESLHQVKPSPFPGVPPGRMFTLGSLSSNKTKYNSIRSYPKNTEVVVEYVYDNPAPVNRGSGAIADARSVSIQYQHSFIEMPENDYRPRYDDPRVGYFMTQKNDQISTSVTPYRDMIHRWHLVKKDPSAAVSEPVEPIVWWIENTTPHEFRETIKEATLAWNEAFEAAGFRNAIEVRVQPDDADWDAGDIRYNVLRWTSSPNPPFGGYGPSFVNPRTGQIIGSDIMLEWVFFSNRVRQQDILAGPSAGESLIELAMDPQFCSFSNHMQHNRVFGANALQMLGANDIEVEDYQHEALKMLVLHELGHTFALNHNMQGSTLHSPEDIHNTNITDEMGLTASVMDYSSANIARDRDRQGRYFDVKPGTYDIWAIQYGYLTHEDVEEEERMLQELLERSTENQFIFGNDADDMRSPGKAIDPRVMVGDMSSDPIAYGKERIGLTRDLMGGLVDKFSREGQSYEALRNAFMVMMGEYRTQTGVMSRYIGGVYRDRAFAGQPGATKPFIPVEHERQKEAMQALTQYLFAPDAFATSHEVYQYLQIQRRGFNFFSSSEDPKLHDMILGMQANALNHLLHPVTMQRITDSRLYGNRYSASDVTADLTAAIFDADARGNVNTFRQNLQIEYVTRLIGIVGGDDHDRLAKSAALYNLQQIRAMMDRRERANAETRAHTAHIKLLIDKAMEG